MWGIGSGPPNYSEQKNSPTKGQISLVRQIAAQITSVNLWEIDTTKVNILFFVVPNNKHLASFFNFIMTLRWDPSDGTVFLHTIKLALQIHITWINLKYDANWPSTIHGTPSVQLYPQLLALCYLFCCLYSVPPIFSYCHDVVHYSCTVSKKTDWQRVKFCLWVKLQPKEQR